MAVTVINKKKTGDIDYGTTKKKPMSATGEEVFQEMDDYKDEVIGRFRHGKGKSSIRVNHPTERLVERNGEWVWVKLR